MKKICGIRLQTYKDQHIRVLEESSLKNSKPIDFGNTLKVSKKIFKVAKVRAMPSERNDYDSYRFF